MHSNTLKLSGFSEPFLLFAVLTKGSSIRNLFSIFVMANHFSVLIKKNALHNHIIVQPHLVNVNM